MASPLRASLLLTCTLALGGAALLACGGEEPVEAEDDAGGETGGGGRRSSSSSSGNGTDGTSSSSSSSSGAASSSGGSTSSGSSGGTVDACEDPEDDVGDMTSPEVLPDTDDSIETIKTVDGMLGPSDEDAYKIKVSDVGGSFLLPDVSTRSLTSNLCVFLECFNTEKTVSVECDSGTKTVFSPKIQGCCIQGQGRITMDYSGCRTGVGLDDSVNAYFRIKNPTDQCVEYNIDYQF